MSSDSLERLLLFICTRLIILSHACPLRSLPSRYTPSSSYNTGMRTPDLYQAPKLSHVIELLKFR